MRPFPPRASRRRKPSPDQMALPYPWSVYALRQGKHAPRQTEETLREGSATTIEAGSAMLIERRMSMFSNSGRPMNAVRLISLLARVALMVTLALGLLYWIAQLVRWSE